MVDRARLLERLSAAGREHSNAMVMFHTALAAHLGLGPSENKALDLLEREGPMSPGNLARQTGLAPASVTDLLDRLARRGFVRREQDPADGRRQLVHIERREVPRIRALFAELTSGLADLYASYSDEQLELILDWMARATAIQQAATTALTQGEPTPGV